MIAARSYIVTCLGSVVLAAGLAAPAAAQLSSRPADEWITRLESPERVAALKIDQILAHLDLKPGEVIADVGAGPGVFSLPLAHAVAPGTVYAIEVDQKFLDHINMKTEAQHITNVKTVLGKFEDPNLPAKDVDLAFIHDVLHHIDKRAEYLKATAAYLKPGGRIVVIEPDAKTGSHKADPSLQVTKEELDSWMAAAGLKRIQEVQNVVPANEWFLVYGR